MIKPDHPEPLLHGYHAVAPGDIACVVAALEMLEPPAALRRLTTEAEVPVQIVRWKDSGPEKYRLLYKRIGGPWSRSMPQLEQHFRCKEFGNRNVRCGPVSGLGDR